MLRLRIVTVLLLSVWPVCFGSAQTPSGTICAAPKGQRAPEGDEFLGPPASLYRGWDFLVDKLRRDQIPEERLRAVFQDERLPCFTAVPFALKPRENHRSYHAFSTIKRLRPAEIFLQQQALFFERAEKNFGVTRFVIAAIFLIESHFGRNTGRAPVLYRLARLASVAEPANMQRNLARLEQDKEAGPVTAAAVQARADYLAGRFYPEVAALFELTRRQNVDILEVRGSSAGALGIPQFLPGNIINFGVDGDGNGEISLFTPADAIPSTANFLASYGWKEGLTPDQRRAVIWRYNHSEAYVDAVLRVAELLKRGLPPETPKAKTKAPRPKQHKRTAK